MPDKYGQPTKSELKMYGDICRYINRNGAGNFFFGLTQALETSRDFHRKNGLDTPASAPWAYALTGADAALDLLDRTSP